MRVIGYGSNFEIYGNDLQTYDKLPAGTYAVKFNPMSGFSLKKVDDFKQLEEKVYGNHAEKIEKVIEAFNRMNRSLGVIMSGDKGIGKSMFTQILAEKAVTIDMPVIIVDKAYKGIASFLESIDQEVLVLTEKGFGKRTAASEYPTKGRGGKGIKTLNVAAKNGPLAGLVTVSGDEDMVVMTDTGVVIRTNVSNISQTGRSTMGVKVMRLDDDAKIMTFALVAAEEEKEDIKDEE